MLEVIKNYAFKRIDLLKMEVAEKSVVTAGIITFAVLAGIAGIFFVLLLNIGLGLLIGSYLGNYAYGILIMAGLYLLILVIIFLSKNAIKNKVANSILKSLNE